MTLHVVALHRAGLQQIEPLTLRNALHHVDQDDIGQFLIGDPHRAIRADVSGAHNRDFLSHNKTPLDGRDLKADYNLMRPGSVAASPWRA